MHLFTGLPFLDLVVSMLDLERDEHWTYVFFNYV